MNQRLAQIIPFGRKRHRHWYDAGALNQALPVLGGLGLGAGLMFILDPNRGNRRRALLRDKTSRVFNRTGSAIGSTARGFSHRARGLAAKAGSSFRRDEVSDEVLVERVRSKMGHIVSHPHAINVDCDAGRVTLSGPILSSEAEKLIKQVSRLRGVKEIEDRLERHDTAGEIPALQGGRQRRGERSELMQSNWSPAARVLTGVAGSALLAWGIDRRGLSGTALGALGSGLLARSITNAGVRA